MGLLQLIFCSSTTACDIVRIPIFVFQTCHMTVLAINRYFSGSNLTIFTVDSYLVAGLNRTVCTVDCNIAGLDCTLIAIDFNFIACFNNAFVTVDCNLITGFDSACCAIHRNLFRRISPHCYLVFEAHFVICRTIRISGLIYLDIITCRYCCSSCCCRFIQLGFINRILRICTVSYVCNLIASCINTIFRHRWTISNLHAVFCNSSQRIAVLILNGHTFTINNGFTVYTISAIVESYGIQTFKIFCQTNIEHIIFTDNTDIVFGQLIFTCNTTLNVQLFIKFFLDGSTGITTVFHTIVFGCHLMSLTVFILVLNTSDYIAVEIGIALISNNIRIAPIFSG